MATVDRPSTHREELRMVVDAAGSRFALVATALFLGSPAVAYLSGVPEVLFYVHVALGAFWFGADFFFKFVLGPSLEALPDETTGPVNEQLIPKMTVVLEPLSLAVVGSGIALAEMMGYWAAPDHWLWGALGIGLAMLVVGFGPLHLLTTRMSVELSAPDPDGERLEALFGKTMKWGLVQTVFMLLIVLMMTGLRW